MPSFTKDELLARIANAVASYDACIMAVYKDNTEIVRHVGFVLAFSDRVQYTIDYGAIGASGERGLLSQVKSEGLGGVYGSSGEYCQMTSPLAQISLKTKQDSYKFIEMIKFMIKNCSPTYSAFKSNQNCRGYVLRHISTVCKTYDVPSAYQQAATSFIEAIKQEDIVLGVGSAAVGVVAVVSVFALLKWAFSADDTKNSNNNDKTG
jgi:hypothetical protein